MTSDQTIPLALLLRFQRGDNRAFEPIIREYQPVVVRFIRWMVKNPHVAEELAQETFLKAWGSIDSFREGARVRPWLLRIARNLALDYIRRAEHRYPREVFEDQAHRSSDYSGPEAQAEAHRYANAIEEALTKLSAGDREILLLGVVEGLSYPEMASVLEISEAAAKGRFLRARRALRKTVGPRS